MKTIKLSDAMKQLPVAEAVKNLYGSDTNGALSQFTMDRIAAVAGESSHFFSAELTGSPATSHYIDIAKFIVSSLPNIQSLRFDVLFKMAGTHYAFGFVYANKTYGMINIQTLGAKSIKTIYIENGTYKE